MSEIFISYAREDRERIQPLAECLERHGWVVFWDRKIQAGQQWHDVISQALDGAQRVIVAWSKDSLGSDFVRDEAASAQARRILMPILLDPVTPPLGFRQIQTADFTGWHGEEDAPALEQLLKDLGPPPTRHASSLPAAAVPAPAVRMAAGGRKFPVIPVGLGAGVLLVGILAYAIFSPEDGRANGAAPLAIPVSSTAIAKTEPVPSASAIPSAEPASTVPVTVEESAGAAERRELLQTLRAYYRDLNAGRFDAERYFAPRVSLYISMKNATPTMLNRYYKSDHPRMYQEFQAEMQEETLTRKGLHVFAYREISRFLQTSDKRRRKMTTEVTVTVNDSAKITSLAHSRISG